MKSLRVVQLFLVRILTRGIAITPLVLIRRRIRADSMQAILQTRSELRGIEEGEASMHYLEEDFYEIKCKAVETRVSTALAIHIIVSVAIKFGSEELWQRLEMAEKHALNPETLAM